MRANAILRRTIEDVDGLLPLGLDEPAIKAAAKFDALARRRRPERVEARRVDAEDLARVKGIEDDAVREGLLPAEAERLLELIGGDGHILRLQKRGLRRDRVVVLSGWEACECMRASV